MTQLPENKMTKNKTGHKARRIITNVICSIIIFVLVAASVMLFVGRANNKVTFIFDRAVVWIATPSMTGTIDANSYILVRRASADDVAVGDVIMFYSDDPAIKGKLNTHRVVDISPDDNSFITKGDANLTNDKVNARRDSVVGKYERSLNVLTALVRFFLKPIGLITLLFIIMLFTAVLCRDDIKKFINGNKEKQTALDEKERERLINLEIERLKQSADNPPMTDPKESNDDGGQTGV